MCLCGLHSPWFDNDDRLRRQVIMGIEPVFPYEDVPLMLEGKTQTCFILRSMIGFPVSIKQLHYLFCCLVLFIGPV